MSDSNSGPIQADFINKTTTGSNQTFGDAAYILRYGVDNVTVTGLLIDSYNRSVKFATKDEIVGPDGLVHGVRYNDARAEVSISGRVAISSTPAFQVGMTLQANGDTIIIEDISVSAGSKDFCKIDIKGVAYQSVTPTVINGA